MALSLITSVCSLLATCFFSLLIDEIIPSQQRSALLALTVLIALVYALSAGLDAARAALIASAAKTLNCKMMLDYISHLPHIQFEQYMLYTKGDFVSRLQDADTVRDAVSEVTVTAMLDLLLMALGFATLCSINPRLFALSLVFVALYAAAIARYNKPIEKTTRELRENDAATTTRLLETVESAEMLKAYQVEEKFVAKNDAQVRTFMEAYRKGMVLFSRQSILSGAIMLIAGVAVLAIGGADVMNGAMSLGSLMTFNALFTICLSPIQNLVNLWPTLKKASVSAQRLVDMLELPLEETREGEGLPSFAGDIVFEGVTFRYGNREAVLDRASFHAAAGKTTALVSKSGSGKSTAGRLLMKLLKPESGTVYLDGKDLWRISTAALRSHIAYLSQKTYLIAGSLLENIRLGNQRLTPQQAVAELDQIGYSRWIAQFPLGYQTVLAENGENLSGGQRQLIGFGRELLRGAQLYILDEATSAMDEELSDSLLQMLRQAKPEATLLIISHNGNIVRGCDAVISFTEGKVLDVSESRVWKRYGSVAGEAPAEAQPEALCAAAPPSATHRRRRASAAMETATPWENEAVAPIETPQPSFDIVVPDEDAPPCDEPPPKPKRHTLRTVLITIAIMAVLFLGGSYLLGSQMLERERYTVAARDFSFESCFSGTLAPVNDETQYAESQMKVQELWVKKGDAVEKGQRLFTCDNGLDVYARYAGEIVSLEARPGATLQAGGAIARIVDYGELEILMEVDEYDIASFSVGKRGKVKIIPLDQTTEGAISALSYAAESKNDVSYYAVKASAKLPSEAVNGMSVEFSVENAGLTNVLAVPIRFLRYDVAGEPYVTLESENGEQQRKVTLGRADADWVEVREGLTGGDVISLATLAGQPYDEEGSL